MTRDELIQIDQRIDQIKKNISELAGMLADHDLIYWSLENARVELSDLSKKLHKEKILSRQKELGFVLLKNAD